jgi:hypothetical protein
MNRPASQSPGPTNTTSATTKGPATQKDKLGAARRGRSRSADPSLMSARSYKIRRTINTAKALLTLAERRRVSRERLRASSVPEGEHALRRGWLVRLDDRAGAPPDRS